MTNDAAGEQPKKWLHWCEACKTWVAHVNAHGVSENEALLARLRAVRADAQRLTAEVARLRAQMAERREVATALVGQFEDAKARVRVLEDEIVKLRADVVWIAQQRDENEQWARDRATVAIQMADERDAARAEVERLKAQYDNDLANLVATREREARRQAIEECAVAIESRIAKIAARGTVNEQVRAWMQGDADTCRARAQAEEGTNG